MKTFLFCTFYFLSLYNADAQAKKESLKFEDISAIDADYPLFLEKINFNDKSNIVQLNDEKRSRIEFIARTFYYNECAGDSSETYFSIKDVYFNTIQLQDSLHTWYLILLKHMPGARLNAKLLLYYNESKTFLDTTYDYNLSALYDVRGGKIVASNLKKEFAITGPEAELVYEKTGGIAKYKFTRLFHNGTFSAIETHIFKIIGNIIEEQLISRNLSK